MPESTVGKEKDFYIAFPPNGAYDMFKLEEKADEENPYDEFDQDMIELYLKVRVPPLITVSFPPAKSSGLHAAISHKKRRILAYGRSKERGRRERSFYSSYFQPSN